MPKRDINSKMGSDNSSILDISLEKNYSSNEILLLKESYESVIKGFETFYDDFIRLMEARQFWLNDVYSLQTSKS